MNKPAEARAGHESSDPRACDFRLATAQADRREGRHRAFGRGAIPLGEKWTAPGQLLTGLAPNVDFYFFVVVKDAADKPSKPSKAFKVNLKDMFPMK